MNTQFNIFQLISEVALAHFYKSMSLNTNNYKRSKAYRKVAKGTGGVNAMAARYDLKGRTLSTPVHANLIGTEGGWYAGN